jgi:flagellum-specific peptidoglycan hydrolase FlgJ
MSLQSAAKRSEGSSGSAGIPNHVRAFITDHCASAQKVNKTWGVPASVVLAQSGLESGWGQHAPGNAYFGIKGRSPSGNSTEFSTTEVVNGQVVHTKDKFRAYVDYDDAADDYGRFLNQNSRYRPAFAFTHDPIRFVQEIAKAGYSTAPNYAQSLISIITGFGLQQYDVVTA